MRLITVITVVYNGVSTIEETILSVARQSFENYEYIIVDGGSTDGTINIVKEYTDNITKWISEPDNGIYDAMNKAIDLASGEWLYFLNSGDIFIHQHVLLTVAKDLIKSANNLYAYRVNVLNKKQDVIDQLPHATSFTTFRQLFYNRFCHQAIFARRADYIKAGKYNTAFKVYSDFFTIARIIKTGVTVVFSKTIIAAYNNMGISSNWKNVVSLSQERETILALLDENFSRTRFFIAIVKARIFYLRKSLTAPHV